LQVAALGNAVFVDSHCHLSSPELAGRMPEIRAAMAEAKVDRALCICTTLDEFPAVHALATSHDNFWCSAGVHPDEEDSREPTVEQSVRPGSTTSGSPVAASPTWPGSASVSGSTFVPRVTPLCPW
jgi:hypothetical protein